MTLTGGPLAVKIVEGIVFSIIIILSLVGNTLVVLAVYRHRSLRIVCNYYIVSLAIADLLVSLFVLPFSMMTVMLDAWVFGLAWCQIWMTLDVFLCTSSIMNLCAISVDRFRAITTPLKYAMNRSVSHVVIISGIMWLVSLAVAITPVIFWSSSTSSLLEDSGMCALPVDPAFVVTSSIIAFFVPCLLMIACYFIILRVMRKKVRWSNKVSDGLQNPVTQKSVQDGQTVQQNQAETSPVTNNTTAKDSAILVSCETDKSEPSTAQDNTNTINQQSKHMQKTEEPPVTVRRVTATNKEGRAAKTLGIVMAVFCLCWIPFFVTNVVNSVFYEVNIDLFLAFVWLGYFNSMLNPLLYTCFNMEFRSAFKKLLFCS
ncbi:unnamed protein product [Owenia fusiformis]|uniref:Uncharacterized protein n=1 Tax=Owenia fusiformis TaxID=6347 RepID=A0A8J1T725_OWEFU|nr:unnamed protein product [Owenia fusiformis]